VRVADDHVFVERFRRNVGKALESTLGLEVEIRSGPRIVSQAVITVSLAIDANQSGPIYWTIEQDVALELVKRLTEDPDPAADMATDGATELANILTGCAMHLFEEHGYRCALGVPIVESGELVVPSHGWLSTSCGSIEFAFTH